MERVIEFNNGEIYIRIRDFGIYSMVLEDTG